LYVIRKGVVKMAMKKVMIVDDEKNLVDMVRVLLENDGFAVTEALSGEECLKKAKKERLDIILLDIMMPKMDGWMVYRKLREDKKTRDIPVIILTAKVDTIDKEIGLDVAGVMDYVEKPFVPDDLIRRIRKALERKGGPEG